MRLAGKVALVTGGGTGIGAAIAERFVAEGARVCITGRRQDVLDNAVAAHPPGSAVACAGDVSRDEDVERMVGTALAFGGKLDILVNNAGINPQGGVIELDSAVWRKVIEVNLTGPFLLMKAAIPHMIEANGGSVINISSLGGVRCLPAMAAYATSKAGLIMLTQQAALDYGKHRVRCNVICPGAVRTDMMDKPIEFLASVLKMDKDAVMRLVPSDVPLQRMAEPMEITGTCVYLASDDSSFTTGAVIMVDGGASIVDVGRVAVGRALKDAGVV
jgi:meso-butanediol dehydrogenase / (S,S)-butanediol dehydrogenase / diacetyl reductase